MRHAAVLRVIGFAVYANVLHVPFVFDDLHAIVDNPFVRQLWPLTSGASQNLGRALGILANQASNGSDMSFLR